MHVRTVSIRRGRTMNFREIAYTSLLTREISWLDRQNAYANIALAHHKTFHFQKNNAAQLSLQRTEREKKEGSKETALHPAVRPSSRNDYIERAQLMQGQKPGINTLHSSSTSLHDQSSPWTLLPSQKRTSQERVRQAPKG